MKRSGYIPMLAAVALVAAALGCGSAAPPVSDDRNSAAAEDLVLIEPPANAGAGMPNLFATADGRVLMSWLEPASAEPGTPPAAGVRASALRFATLAGDAWGSARTIARGDDFFVNWADFPSIVETNGDYVAHWLRRNGGPGTAYDIHVARSGDDGDSWEASVVPHHDGTPTEHGFVSLVPEPDGGFTAVWLDGRKFATAVDDAGREMTLRASRFDAQGRQGPVEVLDERICDCCQTSAARIGASLVVVYRDRTADEIRDIWSVRRDGAGWSDPIPVAEDGWQIPGCPVNGPVIVGNGALGAVAWPTLRAGRPEVKVAFTSDAGASFGDPILLDRAATAIDAAAPNTAAVGTDSAASQHPVPLGRVDAAWIDETRVAVSWMVARGAEADIVLQIVDATGSVGERRVVATTSAARSSGFPQLARAGNRLILAWTEPAATASLRAAAVSLGR